MEWLERKIALLLELKRYSKIKRTFFVATYPEMLFTQESVKWLSTNHMNNKYDQLPKEYKMCFYSKRIHYLC